jgi:methylglutaconyl-CoA hydratase
VANEVIVSRDGPVARVTMNRPEVHNAFNEGLITGLQAAFDGLRDDSSVRVVVITGEGRSFSAGADLQWMRRAATWSEGENRKDAVALAKMLRTIAEFPKPVVARIHGNAFGGGSGLAAAADVAVAVESALFGFTEVRLGLVPATIAPHVVAKIGAGRARPLFVTGERLTADRAFEIGLVQRVVPDDELDSAVTDVVSGLLECSPAAQAAAKELVRFLARADAAEADAYTADLIARLRTSEEGREGVNAFLEKRKPGWAHPESSSR